MWEEFKTHSLYKIEFTRKEQGNDASDSIIVRARSEGAAWELVRESDVLKHGEKDQKVKSIKKVDSRED